jgi:hypothetical protein
VGSDKAVWVLVDRLESVPRPDELAGAYGVPNTGSSKYRGSHFEVAMRLLAISAIHGAMLAYGACIRPLLTSGHRQSLESQ